MKGISLHIGVRQVKSGAYSKNFPTLVGAEEDAQSMYNLADERNFESKPPLLGAKATKDAVTKAISDIATDLPEGGLFLLTYSGHGGSLKNPFNDPNDPLWQTWCLYDKQLVDKELYKLWSLFKPNTRILVVSDSCHSGSVIKIFQAYASLFYASQKIRESPGKEKQLLTETNAEVLAEVNACVILFASCQDSQQSKDSDPGSGSTNSRFTNALLEVWDHGAFNGNHKEFLEAIQTKLKFDNSQVPNYFITGKKNPDFFNQKPFTINS